MFLENSLLGIARNFFDREDAEILSKLSPPPPLTLYNPTLASFIHTNPHLTPLYSFYIFKQTTNMYKKLMLLKKDKSNNKNAEGGEATISSRKTLTASTRRASQY
ncbi:hypothetical protein ACKWTF_000643 [Chironomus riparius]